MEGSEEELALGVLCSYRYCNDSCSVEVKQLKSLQQLPGDQRCGYYALYNAIAAANRGVAYSRNGFEEFVASCQATLLAHAARQPVTDKYPWRTSDIKSGLLERVYLPVLIADIQARHPDLQVLSLLEASLSSLRHNHPPIEAARDLERALRDLQGFPLGYSKSDVTPETTPKLAVLVGSAIHWFTFIIERRRHGSACGTRDEWQIIVIDSQNQQTLLASKESLRQIAESLPFTSWLQAGWQRPALVELAVDSFQGVNCVVDILRRRVMNESDHLVWEVVRLNVEGFMGSFPAVGAKATDQVMLAEIIKWNREIFPTPVVRCNILDMLKAVISGHTTDCIIAGQVLREVFGWSQQQRLLLAHLQVQCLAYIEPHAIETLAGLLAIFDEVQQQCAVFVH